MKARISILLGAFLLLFGALGANLYRLQIEKSSFYVQKVKAMEDRAAALELRRGQIFFTDRSGTQIPVALNKDYPVIFAAPNEMKDPASVAAEVASPLGLEAAAVKNTFVTYASSSFRMLVEKADPTQIAFVTDRSPEGIHIDTKQYRFYPYAGLGSQLIGFVGVNAANSTPAGLYGEELYYNNTLAAGDDVHLTIDRNIQAQAEQILAGLITTFKATGGTIIVENPKTGAIITLADAPAFDPNDYASYPVADFLDPAVSDLYEPGSVFKSFTMSAGIDLGVITPDTTYVDKGYATLNNWTIHNANNEVWGRIDMTQVLEHSVNTGAVFAEGKIGNADFYDYVKKFGFDQKTGVDLPNEVTSNLMKFGDPGTSNIDFATAAYGQGIAVTPMQLVAAYGAIANGGLLMRPYVNAAMQPYVIRRVIAPATSAAVTKMLVATVDTGKVAAIPQYNVAGKTGTAYIPQNGKYSTDMIHTFIGFAPATDPQFVMLVKLDRPQVGDLAGLTVLPAFKQLSQFILNYYNIPPDRLSAASQ